MSIVFRVYLLHYNLLNFAVVGYIGLVSFVRSKEQAHTPRYLQNAQPIIRRARLHGMLGVSVVPALE